MPTRAHTPCRVPTCPHLRPCPTHATDTRTHAERIERTPHRAGTYSTAAWKRLRARVLAEQPLCRLCQEQGRVTLATEVDHIVSFATDMALFLDRQNCQGLCKPCHSAKTRRERSLSR